jgi:hypothetical protein
MENKIKKRIPIREGLFIIPLHRWRNRILWDLDAETVRRSCFPKGKSV